MKTLLQVNHYGIDTPHQPDYIIDRPNGFGCYVLMCFSTRYFSRTIRGVETGEPGDCLLHDPSFPVYHGTVAGENEGFRNSWLFLAGDGIATLADRYGIGMNTIVPTGESQLLTPFIKELKVERDLQKPFQQERIQLLLEQMMLDIGRHQQLGAELESLTSAERELRNRFISARQHVQLHYSQDWTVKKMAALVNLSPNRFWVLYHKFFKSTPKDDLITVRLEEAKARLLNGNHSIEHIAAECGFNSFYYFSRLFKQRIGCTPSSFRR